jgi:ATP-binding cassette subfamily C protein LapB
MSKQPFTLTITNGNRARLQASPQVKAPVANNSNTHDDRVKARAELAMTYAGILGIEALKSDAYDAISRGTSEGASDLIEANAIADGLKAIGCLTEVSSVKDLSEDHWPALAYMTSGQVILVLGQSRGDLIIFDKTCTDNRAHVPTSEFKPFFGGMIVRAEAPLDTVAKSHKANSKPTHWFWGQFPKFKRQLAEVALGSFVANLLAVAVALFSLQVYDRVIPHQSEATLWVLAAGGSIP